MTAEPHYSVPAVAAVLDCSRGHIYALINAGKIRTVDIGLGGRSKTRIPEAALKTYLRSLGTEPPAGPQNPPNPTRPRARTGRTRAMTEPTPQPLPPDFPGGDPYARPKATDPDGAPNPTPEPTPVALVGASA